MLRGFKYCFLNTCINNLLISIPIFKKCLIKHHISEQLISSGFTAIGQSPKYVIKISLLSCITLTSQEKFVPTFTLKAITIYNFRCMGHPMHLATLWCTCQRKTRIDFPSHHLGLHTGSSDVPRRPPSLEQWDRQPCPSPQPYASHVLHGGISSAWQSAVSKHCLTAHVNVFHQCA